MGCICVSIHAPAKGATRIFPDTPTAFLFQSTLPRRERRGRKWNSFFSQTFQSTLPRRERPRSTPARSKFLSFNPRSREGSDTLWNPSILPCIQFQSTLPRRERHHFDMDWFQLEMFQSTLPRRERLLYIVSSRVSSSVSIHAPAKGATDMILLSELVPAVSIHAPAKGATT